MSQGLPVKLIIDAARLALSRTAIGPHELCSAMQISRDTAALLIATLTDWHILTLAPDAPRRVLLEPKHERLVLGTITEHGGIPPARNPLDILLGPGMTDQMRDLLHLVAQGDGNLEIGKKLHIHRDTVKKQVAHLVQALQARNRTHLVTVAHQLGLLPITHRPSGKDSR